MKTLQAVFIILISINTITSAQTVSNNLLEDPDVILQANEDTPEVLLVGTFHFSYPGLDAYKTEEKDKINVLSVERQKELKNLVDYIAEFKPNKIMVESGSNTGYLLRRYEDYISSETNEQPREVDQIAFPLMKQFGLDTLYGVDSPSLVRELANHPDSTTLRPIVEKIFTDYDYKNDDPYDKKYDEWYQRGDKLKLDNDLLTIFKHNNSDKVLDRGWGAYLIGDFKNNKYKGSDALMLNWYSRNLRIYRNIQDLTESGDRIMVLFGSGHITILKNLFDCSPAYDLTKFGELEDISKKQ